MDRERGAGQLRLIGETVEIAEALGVEVWLREGWAVDFFTGEVTRDHVDIDWFAWAEDAPALTDGLLRSGYEPPSGPPADPQLSDAELAGQPAAYWTGVAYEALIAYIRARQAEKGYTQPQFWLLRNLSKNDISLDGEGMTLPELRQAMASYIRSEDDLAAEAEVLLERS